MDERVYWIWFVLVFGPANNRIWQLSRSFDTSDRFYRALIDNSIVDVSDYEKKRIQAISLDDAEKVLNDCESAGIDVFCYESEGYPEKLRGIPNPPAVLFVKGSLDFLENNYLVNIAGTREPSKYSIEVTRLLAKELSSKGCVITSGMAEGIDQLANEAAIETGCPTLGICGLAIDSYTNELAASIPEKGALISEFVSEMDVVRPSFSNRNRLLAALCDAVVYVEGALKSRGLNICSQFMDYGKPLFVVPPHHIFDSRYLGQSWLLRQGCRLVLSANDILFYLAHLGVDRLEYDVSDHEYAETEDYSFFGEEVPEPIGQRTEKSDRKKRSKTKSDSPEPAARPVHRDYSLLEERERQICNALTDTPLLADAIAEKLGYDISDVLSMLTMLEMEGYVESLPGKQFGLI